MLHSGSGRFHRPNVAAARVTVFFAGGAWYSMFRALVLLLCSPPLHLADALVARNLVYVKKL